MMWMEQAACRGADDPAIWFSRDLEAQDRAVAVCRRCPVQTPCYDLARAHFAADGIWAGRLNGGRHDPGLMTRGRRLHMADHEAPEPYLTTNGA